jgi:hypothetical protein
MTHKQHLTPQSGASKAISTLVADKPLLSPSPSLAGGYSTRDPMNRKRLANCQATVAISALPPCRPQRNDRKAKAESDWTGPANVIGRHWSLFHVPLTMAFYYCIKKLPSDKGCRANYPTAEVARCRRYCSARPRFTNAMQYAVFYFGKTSNKRRASRRQVARLTA